MAADRWREAHSRARVVLPSSGRYLVLAPHPDDEVLAVGGLCARLAAVGAEVVVVGITDGGMAYPGHFDPDELATLRRAEQHSAVNRLGIASSRLMSLELPDGSVAAHEDTLIETLRPFCSRRTTIVAPWAHDHHSDHEAVGRAAGRIAAIEGCSHWSWLFWTWHHAPVEALDGVELVAVQLDGAEQALKAEALEAHATQLRPTGIEPMLGDARLEPARWPVEYFIVHPPRFEVS